MPEEGKTIIPPGVNVVGGGYHRKTLVKASLGTLSQYRKDDEAIRLDLDLGSTKSTFLDNFVSMELEANNPNEAIERIFIAIDSIVRNLSLSMRNQFSYKPILFLDEQDNVYPLPKQVVMSDITVYNLSQLANEIRNLGNYYSLTDILLTKSQEYYLHSLFLFNNILKWTSIFSINYRLVISAAFLNMWKAISVIIGDPSTDADYQSRYRSLGIDRAYFVSNIEFVRNLRNEYDVAHYATGWDKAEEIIGAFGKAKNSAETIIIAYRNYLLKGGDSLLKIGDGSDVD